jgi:hypothetical protein
MRVRRTRSSPSAPRSPLTSCTLGRATELRAVPVVVLAAFRFLAAFLCVAGVPAQLHGQAPAFACTPTVDFGTVPPGQFALRSMWCTNTQAAPVFFDYGGTVGFADFEPNPCVGGGCYDTFPMVIPPGGRFGITVAFHPTELGPRSGSQTILNDVGLPNSVTTFTGIGGSVQVPMLDTWAYVSLAAGLALVAMIVILKGGGRVA